MGGAAHTKQEVPSTSRHSEGRRIAAAPSEVGNSRIEPQGSRPAGQRGAIVVARAIEVEDGWTAEEVAFE